MYTTCSELGIFMHWTCNSMNNLLSYYGLDDARISASEKDLPVTMAVFISGLVWCDIQTIVVRCNGLIELNLGNCKLSPSHNWVLIFWVEFWELSHLIRDLSQAENKINVLNGTTSKIQQRKCGS